MTCQHVAGELSVRLQLLQAAGDGMAAAAASLRAEAESRPPWALAPVLARALALAERMCWDLLERGDAAGFERLAEIAADLRCFGICAGLLGDDEH